MPGCTYAAGASPFVFLPRPCPLWRRRQPGGEDSVASLEPNSDSPAAADNTKGHTRHNSSSLMEPTDETMEEISLPSSPGEPDAPTSPKRRSEEAQPGNSASAAVDGTLTVTVDNPMKHGDGLFDSHVVFTVNTKTTRSQFAGTSFSVHRRYSDFVWLREMLCHEQRGQIIPPLPPKHVTTMNKFDPVFLNTRRLALQRFILRIVQHEILTHNSSFLHFLQAKAHEFVSIKKEKARGVMDKVGAGQTGAAIARAEGLGYHGCRWDGGYHGCPWDGGGGLACELDAGLRPSCGHLASAAATLVPLNSESPAPVTVANHRCRRA